MADEISTLRRALGEEHTRMVNRLRALLLELIPSGAKRDLSAAQARALLARVRSVPVTWRGRPAAASLPNSSVTSGESTPAPRPRTRSCASSPYSSPYFAHIFAGVEYSAGYYSYVWSEVLDADTVDWFKENGGMTRAHGDRFRKYVIGIGGSCDPLESYREFRGRGAEIEPPLRRRGLLDPAE